VILHRKSGSLTFEPLTSNVKKPRLWASQSPETRPAPGMPSVASRRERDWQRQPWRWEPKP